MSNRTARQHTTDRAVVRVLKDALGFLVPAEALQDACSVKLDHLKPTVAEIGEAIRHAERSGRVLGLTTETGTKYKLTEAGEAWALEVRL
jgi:hypothetical protein